METTRDGRPRKSQARRRQLSMTMFGNKVSPLRVHLIPPSPADSDEEDAPRLCEHEEEAFYHARAIPAHILSQFNVKDPSNKSVPKVEPRSERKVFEDGTLTTITLPHVRKHELLVQVTARKLMVTGVVREDDAGFGLGRKGNTRLMYTFNTGVSEMMDLTTVIAGYREGYVDLFLRRVAPLENDDGMEQEPCSS